MSIKDYKSKIEKLEKILNVNENEPAQWALDEIRFCRGLLINYSSKVYTDEEIYQEALELTQKYGTKENYNKACLETSNNLDFKELAKKYRRKDR
jgi:hypothetical protein